MDDDKPPRLSKKDVFLNYKIWLSGITGDGMIDETTYRLLIEIGKLGSLKAAADAQKISYRKAWGDLEKAEEILGYALTDKQRGGKDGGNSALTPAALRLLEAYRALQQTFDDSVEEAFNAFKAKLKPE
ncbi:MAG: LysR family transcriptional regulator [Bacteroidales bacterium]|nr:LysR family transcriptional regulator [Bacteroidales bacterium]